MHPSLISGLVQFGLVGLYDTTLTVWMLWQLVVTLWYFSFLFLAYCAWLIRFSLSLPLWLLHVFLSPEPFFLKIFLSSAVLYTNPRIPYLWRITDIDLWHEWDDFALEKPCFIHLLFFYTSFIPFSVGQEESMRKKRTISYQLQNCRTYILTYKTK